MLIDFANIEDSDSQECLTVRRNRSRGDFVNNNTFVLYRRPRFEHAFGLFLHPSSQEYTAPEIGGRFIFEGRADAVIAGGETSFNLQTRVLAVSFKFITPDPLSVREVGRLVALGFNHDDMSDFRAAIVTYECSLSFEVTTVAELIRKYIDPHGNT